MSNNHVIFIHPDGTSPSHYAAARFISQGPDGKLSWDTLSNAGVYLGHMKDQIIGTSNGGAVTHANGVKVYAESYGLDENGNPVQSLSTLNNPDVPAGTTICSELQYLCQNKSLQKILPLLPKLPIDKRFA